MNRVSLVVCQLLLMLLKCDCDSEWTRNAIFVTVEIEDEPMDNSLVEQLQKLSELGVDGVIISNSFSLMRVKSSTTSEMSKLDELFLLLAENELKVLVNIENHLNSIFSKFYNNSKIADIDVVDDNETYKNNNIFNEVKHCMSRLIGKYNVNGFAGKLAQILSQNSSHKDQFVKNINSLLDDWSVDSDSKVFVFIVDQDDYFTKKSSFENLTHVAFSLSHLSTNNRILQILLPGIVILPGVIDDETSDPSEIYGSLERFHQFIRLRNCDVFKEGSVVYIPFSDDVSIIKRELEGSIYFLFVNLNDQSNGIELKAVEEIDPESLQMVASSTRDVSVDLMLYIEAENLITLEPFEILVLKKLSCNYCERSKKNKFLAISVFTSMLSIGVVYVIIQRYVL